VMTLLLLPAVSMNLAAVPPRWPRRVGLGGPREASATIRVAGGGCVGQARMPGARCFRTRTNPPLNRQRGSHRALLTLARSRGGSKTAELTVVGATIEKHGPDGKFHTLTLRVPRAGVVVFAREGKPAQRKELKARKAERVTLASDLFTRKRDHLQTL